MMRYRYILPANQLKDYIDYYFVIENETPENAFPVEVFPSPQAEMVFTYGDEHSSYSTIGKHAENLSADYAVSGFFTQKATYRNKGKLGVIMVGFKPWGIQSFIDFPVGEITNENLSLKELYPAKIRDAEDEIRSAQSLSARINIIEKFLCEILQPREPDQLIVESVNQISCHNGQMPVRELAAKFHLCEKQFKRRFSRTVGIPPKLFSRLVRFQYILSLMNNARIKLLDVAIETGFYDEAHFIREFEEFTNTSPKKYLQSSLKTDLGSYFDEQVKKSLFYNTIYK